MIGVYIGVYRRDARQEEVTIEMGGSPVLGDRPVNGGVTDWRMGRVKNQFNSREIYVKNQYNG